MLDRTRAERNRKDGLASNGISALPVGTGEVEADSGVGHGTEPEGLKVQIWIIHYSVRLKHRVDAVAALRAGHLPSCGVDASHTLSEESSRCTDSGILGRSRRIWSSNGKFLAFAAQIFHCAAFKMTDFARISQDPYYSGNANKGIPPQGGGTRAGLGIPVISACLALRISGAGYLALMS